MFVGFLCILFLNVLGLCYKKMGQYEEAIDCFHKIQLMLPNSAEVICQLGSVYLFVKWTILRLDFWDLIFRLQIMSLKTDWQQIVLYNFDFKMQVERILKVLFSKKSMKDALFIVF